MSGSKDLSYLHEKIVADVPALQRNRVWCWECGKTYPFDSATGLRKGWPKCCGATMSIDPPKPKKA